MPEEVILLLESDPRIRSQMDALAADRVLGVVRVDRMEAALERLKNRGVRLVVADLDGSPEAAAAIGALAAAAAPVPLIVTAAGGSVHGAVEALHQGAFDYLVKPVVPELLAASVQRALARTEAAGGRVGRSKPIIYEDPRMAALLKMARSVAASTATVLILGESGTGKELLAAEILRHSPRRDRPYVMMNCAALPENLAESELFGHEKGAFTGALGRKAGKFELADGGTLLLDEISELPLGLQAKLLRVIQEGEIDRVGGTRPVPVDVRLIAISNVDLKQAVSEGRFRADLFYRINVVPLTVAPLRQRPADILPLARHFLERHALLHGRPMRRIAPEALARLAAYRWPGNVRELEHVIERAVLIGDGDTLEPDFVFLDDDTGSESDVSLTLQAGLKVREMEERLVDVTLKAVDGNRQQAAEMLGISIRTLRNKLNEYKHRQPLPAVEEPREKSAASTLPVAGSGIGLSR